MSENKNNCHMDQNNVHHLNHAKAGTLHILGGLHDTEGMVSAVFLAKADYVKGDSFMLEAETYIASSQDDVVLVSGFFKAGSLVHVLVDTEKKRLGFTRGTNGAEKAPLSAEGHLLVGDSEGNPADSGKTVDDFDPAGSAQTVQVELEKHEANGDLHLAPGEREDWNGKADRDYVDTQLANKANLSGGAAFGGPVSVNNYTVLTAKPLQWNNLPLINGVTGTLSYTIWNGLVTIAGTFTPNVVVGTTNLQISTLPVGCRPKRIVGYRATAGTGVPTTGVWDIGMSIAPNGSVNAFYSNDPATVSYPIYLQFFAEQ